MADRNRTDIGAPPMLPAIRRSVEAPTLPGRGADNRQRLLVGPQIALTGEISRCDTVSIEGEVNATVGDCRALEIAEGGSLKGKAEIAVAEIAGRFEGEITVRERLILKATGRIIGTVRYAALEIEAGGQVEGTMELLAESDAGDESKRTHQPLPR